MFAAAILIVAGCRDDRVTPTQTVKKTGAQPAKVVCMDGTFDCFCELFGVNCPDSSSATLSVVEVAGPNPAGSFTTLLGENVVTLRADVVPPTMASRVQ